MIKDHGRFRDVAAGVQSIAITAAVVVGGAWAIATFEVQRARAEYQRMVEELRALRVVNIEMAATTRRDSLTDARYIFVVITFENAGRTTEVLYWPEVPLTASLVTLDNTARPALELLSAHRLDAGVESGIRLMPGVKMQRVFVVQVAESGMYFLQLEVDASDAEQALAQEEGVGYVSWGHDAIVWVP